MNKKTRRLLSLLLGGGRYKTLSGVPPLTYKAIEGTLENYRIYGNTVNGENVGDLITEGEHAGEYKVPVTVEGKNLLQNTTTSQTINGVTFTVNEDGSVTCNGTASNAAWFPVNRSFDLYAPEGRIASIANNGSMSTFYMNISYIGNVTTSRNYSSTTHQNVYVQLVIAAGYTCDNLTFYPMIRKADIEDDTYEPYHAPVTTPIYLPEPLKMVGGEAEYVDFEEQKLHRVGADDIDITLPELPTLEGTNVLTVGTEVQPSAVEIRGRISAVQTALNMAALSPVSMSMPDGFVVMSESEEVVNYADNQGEGQEQSED